MNEDFDIYVNTILNWIQSCKLQTQLQMCLNAIEVILRQQFKKKVDYFELENATALLSDAIDMKYRELAATTQEEREQLVREYQLIYKSESI